MEAKEYVKKITLICGIYRPKGECSNCPLHHHYCGMPETDYLLDEVLKIVKEFILPPEKYICPRCENEENDVDAKYCKICGLEIRELI